MKNLTRPIVVKAYLNDEEKDLLDAKIKHYKAESKTEYLRQLIINGPIYHVNYSEIKDLIPELESVAAKTNLIAHKVNSTNIVETSDIEELYRLFSEARRIVEEIRNRLGSKPLKRRSRKE